MSWLPYDNASLTNRIDLTVNSLALFVESEDDFKDIYDIFMDYNDIAVVEQSVVNVGGGVNYTTVDFNTEDVDDWHVPGLESMLTYLNENYQKKNDFTSRVSTKKTNMLNQEINQTYLTKKYKINNNIKKVPIIINNESNFYYIKKSNNNVINSLIRRLDNLQAEVDYLKSQIP